MSTAYQLPQPRLPLPETATAKSAPRWEWAFSAIVVLWLFGLNFPALIETQQMDTWQVVSLAWIAPLLLLVGTNQCAYAPVFRASSSVRISLSALILAISISATMSLDPLRSAGYVASAILGLWGCAGVWPCSKRMDRVLAGYAVMWSAFSVLIYLEGTKIMGRLTYGTGQPNSLAILNFGALACCLSIPNLALRLPLIAINLFIIIETQGRGSLLAAAITLIVYIILSRAYAFKRTRLSVFAHVAAIVFALAGLAVYWREVVDAASALLFLEDKYRGVGSGFTGRTDAWQEAYQFFADNPFFGVGFRVHGQYMSGVIKSAHNGYLSMLADAGLGGLITALTLIGVCAKRLWGMARTGDHTAIIGLSFVAGYLFIAFFERLLVNFGSATSTLMWIFLLMPGLPRAGTSSSTIPVKSLQWRVTP